MKALIIITFILFTNTCIAETGPRFNYAWEISDRC